MIAAVLFSIVQMFGLMALGWAIRKLNYLGENDWQKLSKVTVDFLYPLLIFGVVVTDLDRDRIAELWLLPVLGFGIMAFGALVGWGLAAGLKTKDPEVRKAFLHICAINNFGFLPIYIIENCISEGLVSPTTLPMLFVFHLGSLLGFWTVGVATLGSMGSGSGKGLIRQLFSPALIALIVSIGAGLIGARDWIPQPLMEAVRDGGGIAVPLMLLITGGTLTGGFSRSEFRDVGYLTVVRCLLLPALCLIPLAFISMPSDLRFIWVVVALMPAAATSPVMTRIYGGSTNYASAVVLTSTLLSGITIPIGFALCLLGN